MREREEEEEEACEERSMTMGQSRKRITRRRNASTGITHAS